MFGPPGTGKTMLARAFASVLPHLSREEILEITGIHSIAGTLENGEVLTHPPVRSPHHTSSYVAIIGGGASPKPGEITLSHRGVLFLDEFPEFDRKVLESLRQPLEDRVVTISRAQGTSLFPASFILLAAMNPCPCGFYGSEKKVCTCSAYDITRYQKKISGPIVDRIDIWLPVEHIDYEKLSEKNDAEKVSPQIRDRIMKAREFSFKRKGASKLNVEMSSRDIQNEDLSDEVKEILNKSAESMSLSPRAYHRVIKLARTIADMEAKEKIAVEHILEALQYRPQMGNI
jgi:magnesium chelatase family protein